MLLMRLLFVCSLVSSEVSIGTDDYLEGLPMTISSRLYSFGFRSGFVPA